MARFDWTYEEVVLAADLVAHNDWQGLRATNPKVIELSVWTTLENWTVLPPEK